MEFMEIGFISEFEFLTSDHGSRAGAGMLELMNQE